MKKIKSKLMGTVIALTLSTNCISSGIPTVDGAVLSNDVTSWIKDTMTELEHHIADYDMMIAQYTTLYNQYEYVKNQYTGLVDSFKNIHDLSSLMDSYRNSVALFNQTVDTYNAIATASNRELATICDKLSSKTLNAEACSQSIRDTLAKFDAVNKQIKFDTDPDAPGSPANLIVKDAETIDKMIKEKESRRVEDDSKEGQILEDMRANMMLLNKQLLAQRQINYEILIKLGERASNELTKETDRKAEHKEFRRSLEQQYDELNDWIEKEWKSYKGR